MRIETAYCDNYFPPTAIECYRYKTCLFLKTDYRYPSDGFYDKELFGRWNVKYKKIDPHYYCDGQRHLGG